MQDETHLRQLAMPLLGKWSIFIILTLAEEKMYFAQLERSLDGISRKVLTQNLNELIEINIIHKEGKASTGYKTYYHLTKLGHSLLPLIFEIKKWIRENEESLSNKED